jgi:phosphoribosyl-AMP cyclohydrolase
MMAWMNPDAVARTLETGRVTYWSRSRAAFWVKGESSGHVQELVELRVDCDRDCLLALVRQTGPACHTNRRSCFYTALRDGDEVEIMAPMVE